MLRNAGQETKAMTRCKNCLIPEIAPGVQIASDGLCNLCKEEAETNHEETYELARQEREGDFEQTIAQTRGQAEYDCMVPLSGGKDSIYLLHRLKNDYKLKVLAFTVDVNIPDLAWQSIRRALDKLEIDHIVVRPPAAFYHKLFRYLLNNQEERGAVYTVSYVYAPLFEGDALQLAMAKGIPLVLAGYSPGQPEPERMLYEFSRQLIEQTDWTPPQLRASGEFTEDELQRFYNPLRYPPGTAFPRYLAPFHAWPYHQEDIMRQVVELGLVATRKHANPIHSNYPINWLLMFSDLRHLGYNPYVPEFSALIRRGQANRNYWRVMAPVVDFLIRNRLGPAAEVSRSLRELDLTAEELRINQPKGAYDPPVPLQNG